MTQRMMKLTVAMRPSPKVRVGFSVRTCTRTLCRCRKRFWNVACDSSRSDWGRRPVRNHASFRFRGSRSRFSTNSRVALALMTVPPPQT